GPVLGLDPPELAHRAPERLVPRHRLEPGRRAHQRVEQPVGVVVLQVALDALRAELPPVEGEVVAGLEADDPVAGDLQQDPALLPAEAAVRAHLAVDRAVVLPAVGRRVVAVGPEPGDQLLLGQRRAGHQPNPPTRSDWARATSARRQRGQNPTWSPPPRAGSMR